MEILKNRDSVYCGTTYFESSLFFVSKSGSGIVWIKTRFSDDFELFIKDCPEIKSDIDVWKIILDLPNAYSIVNQLRDDSYRRGIADGRREIQWELRNLLGIK